MKKIRIGLIGCGGRQWSHIRPMLEMEDVEIVALAEPADERRTQAAEATGASRLYKNHTEFLANETKATLDAVVIAVEPTAHDNMELRLIDMGIPFIVEKPMTIDIEYAEKVAKAAEEKGVITSVGFQDRYLDLMDMIKDELPKHKQGGVVHGTWAGGIPGVWWWQKKADCGGQLVEQNIHLLDGLRWLYGEPLSVYAVNARGIVKPGVDASAEYDTDDYSVCVFRFENNVTATLTSACYLKDARPNCGFIIMLSDMIIDYRLRNNLIMKTDEKTIDINRMSDQTARLDRVFVDAVKTGDASAVRSPYSDALKSLKAAFAANESMETGKVIYFK